MSLADTLFNNLQGSLVELAQNMEKEYRVKVQKQEDLIKRLQERVDELENQSDQKENIQLDDLERFKSQDIDNILDEIHAIDNDQKDENEQDDDDNDKVKTKSFWDQLIKNLREGNIEFVKDKIRKKEVQMNELDSRGRNLLMLATEYGSYELVITSLLLSLLLESLCLIIFRHQCVLTLVSI